MIKNHKEPCGRTRPLNTKVYEIQRSPFRLGYNSRPTETIGCTESSRHPAPSWAYISMVTFNVCYGLCVKLPPPPQAHVFDTQYPVDGTVRERCEIFSGWSRAGGSRLLGWSLMFYNWHLLPIHLMLPGCIMSKSVSCYCHVFFTMMDYDSGTISPKQILCP